MGWLKRLFGRKPKADTSYTGGPAQYAVIRRPTGVFEYAGSSGAKARRAFEVNSPKEGETLELWDRGACRGRK